MRLIDADRLYNTIIDEIDPISISMDGSEMCGMMRTIIAAEPTIDAVPLNKLCRYLEVYARTPIYNMQHTAEWWKEEIRERKLGEMDGGTKCC